MTTALATNRLTLVLPPGLEATEPPEARGSGRDDVRLLVSIGTEPPLHRRFRDIVDVLAPGDLLVVNTSATLPAALDARRHDGREVVVHLSNRLDPGSWVVEVRHSGSPASRPGATTSIGEILHFPGGGRLVMGPKLAGSDRLRHASLSVPGDELGWLARHGRPIRYGYVRRAWPIAAYQTVYADEPGSAEMPSAGRAFTPEIISALAARGVGFAPLVLHTGVSSMEGDEAPSVEQYRIPVATAERVNATRARGGRVIAVGTTVVRSLETVVDADGMVRPGEGWTDLVITPERGVTTVDGVLTGWHPPEASHLLMLEAIAGREALVLAYEAAVAERYRWHEFGDLHLILRRSG